MSTPIYGEFLSSNGENPIITYTWLPETNPIGVVQIVHGMREHMGRYSDFAEFLNSKGFIVTGHDHLGHGKTALEYGIYGFFGKHHGAKVLVADSNLYTKQLSQQYSELPLFLIGHSMGSFITRLQVLTTSDLIAGYICMGTGGDNGPMPYLRAYAGFLSKTKGPETSSVFINKSIDKIFHRCLEKGETGDAWISHNIETVKAYQNDPFTRFYFTNQGYADLADLQIACNRDQWYQRMDPLLSMLLVSGSDDPVSNMGKDIPKIYNKLVENSLMADVSFTVYENMRHEILNEINNIKVYNDILEWINKHLTENNTLEA